MGGGTYKARKGDWRREIRAEIGSEGGGAVVRC